MSAREEEILLGQIIGGIVDRATPRTTIATVIDGNEVDRTSCFIRVGQDTRQCMVLIPNIRVRAGNRIKVRPDGNGRYEMIGGVDSSDATSGVFPDPSVDSPFPPTNDGTDAGPIETAPVDAGTKILDRRPENEYDIDGTVQEPTGGRSGENPTPPGGGSGQGPLFPIDIPGSGTLPWATGDQIRPVLSGDASGGGAVRRVPHADHQHAHGVRPITEWPIGEEPHPGYAPSDHTHPAGATAAPLYTDVLQVPVNDTTKAFATEYRFVRRSVQLYLNGLLQVPQRADTPGWEYTEDADLHGVTVVGDVVVDGTTVDQDVPDVLVAIYAVAEDQTGPVEPEPEGSGWGTMPWSTGEWGS